MGASLLSFIAVKKELRTQLFALCHASSASARFARLGSRGMTATPTYTQFITLLDIATFADRHLLCSPLHAVANVGFRDVSAVGISRTAGIMPMGLSSMLVWSMKATSTSFSEPIVTRAVFGFTGTLATPTRRIETRTESCGADSATCFPSTASGSSDSLGVSPMNQRFSDQRERKTLKIGAEQGE